MASENKRHFEVRLGKLGILTLVCSMSSLLFVFFLFGVVVGNNLEVYPEKISRRFPLQVLQWCGLLEYDKVAPVAAKKHHEQRKSQETETIPAIVVRNVQPDQEKSSSNRDVAPQVKQEIDDVVSPSLPPAKKIEEVLKSDKEKKSENKYLIQITSCKDKKIAEEVVAKVAKAGFKVQVTMVDLKEKGIWYRVTLSGIDSQKEAMEAAQKIDHILKGNKSVVRVQKR